MDTTVREYGRVLTTVDFPDGTTAEDLDPAVRTLLEYDWASTKVELLLRGHDLSPMRIVFRRDNLDPTTALVGWTAEGSQVTEGDFLARSYLRQAILSGIGPAPTE